MFVSEKAKHIFVELKGHAPFTILGAAAGVFFMLLFKGLQQSDSATLFSIFHPAHVLLSAMVTASLFELHRHKKNFLAILIVGYIGSIGVATLSDSVIPYLGEQVLGLGIPAYHEAGEDNLAEFEQQGRPAIHLGFIEEWYIVNPAAILGVLIAYFLPRTKFPHAGHVLLSTWASSSHILMNTHCEITGAVIIGMFVVLFVAVWIPCCISDIVFPLLFVKSDLKLQECDRHDLHAHPHKH